MIKSLINSYVKIGIVLVLMFSVLHSFGQSSQPFEILLYHGQDAKTPFEGVSVSAVDASTVMSDAQGQLTLTFRTRKFGDQIQFRRIDCSGYEVMNTEAIEAARISRPSADDPDASKLRIVMAPQQLLRQLRDGYRSVAVQRYEKQLKASEAEIQRLREAGKLAEEEYNERMNQLEEDYEAQLSKLETYIEKFARIDLSDLDADERQIIALVQQGEFEEALALYDKQDLANRLRQSRADQQKLAEASQQIAAAERQKALENQRLRQSIDRQVILLRMAGGEENLQKAYQIIHETFLADTTDVTARRTYAMSLFDQGQPERADLVLQIGIEAAANNYDRGFMVLDLMDDAWRRQDYAAGLTYAQRADSLLTPLQESDYTVLTRGLPAFCSVYLNYYLQEDLDRCRQIVDRMQQQWSPDTLSYNSLLSYIEVSSGIGEYYSQMGNMTQSKAVMSEALRLGEILYRKFPVYSTLYNACAEASSVFALAGDYVEACQAVRRSMALMSERLEKTKVKTLYPIFAYDLYTMSDALSVMEDYQLCDSLMALEHQYQIFASLDSSYPMQYNAYKGCFLLTCVGVKLQNHDVAAAEQLFADGVSSLEQAEEGEHLLPQLRPGTLARIRQAQGRYEEAEQLYQAAIDYFAHSYRESGDVLDADSQCRYLLMLADMQGEQGKHRAFRKTIRQAERIAPFESNRQKVAAIKQKYQ